MSAQIPVLILKEGTSRTRGKEAQRINIMAAKVIAEAVRTALGPRGMDKMLVDSFGDITITNDGVTILDEMDVQHPAAKMIVEMAKAQDHEVGDGTTSVVVMAGELLDKAEDLMAKDVHPVIIIEGYRKAAEKALEFLEQIAERVDPSDREVLKKIAETAMASKLVAEERGYLAELAVEAVLQVRKEKPEGGYDVDIDDVKIEKKPGESLRDTQLVKGVVIDKEVVHPQMPKRIENAKIALLNCPLEVEKTEFSAKIHIETPEQMKAFMDEEARMLREMVENIKKAGANVVFCQKGIDDLAQHYLAKAGILAVRRVKKSDMEKLAKATGGRIITKVEDLSPEDLGEAELVEERKVGEDKMVFVEGCKNPRSVTILIRGGSERVVDEAERSLHDALCVVADVVRKPAIVAGGGAVELELARRLRSFAQSLSGREQLVINAYAEALEVIPTILAENCGMDPIDTLTDLRSRHEKGELWSGINAFKGEIADMMGLNVLEPSLVKEQIIKSSTEAACMILKIDDIIAAARMKEEEEKKPEEEKGEESSEL